MFQHVLFCLRKHTANIFKSPHSAIRKLLDKSISRKIISLNKLFITFICRHKLKKKRFKNNIIYLCTTNFDLKFVQIIIDFLHSIFSI